MPTVLLVALLHWNPACRITKTWSSVSIKLMASMWKTMLAGKPHSFTIKKYNPTWNVSIFIRYRMAVMVFDSVSWNPCLWHRFKVFLYVPREVWVKKKATWLNQLLTFATVSINQLFLLTTALIPLLLLWECRCFLNLFSADLLGFLSSLAQR